MIIYSILFLFIVCGIMTYALLNLLRKYEKLESSNRQYEEFFIKLQEMSDNIQKQIKAIDIRGSFESDDEVGIIYKGISEMVKQLDKFFEEGVNEETQ